MTIKPLCGYCGNALENCQCKDETEPIKDDIVLDFYLRLIVDDISEGQRKEFRCSVYDSENNLITEGWAETPNLATKQAMETY